MTATRPRICILTQYFPPEMGAPQNRLSELGERLIDRGWQVDVLTSLPNYPAGRVFPGYDSRRSVVEMVGRMRTARVPLLPSQKGFARRLAAYFSFAGAASALGPRLLERPDLLFVESPPLFLGLGGLALAARWRCPYVFNVSDLWPESAVRLGVVPEGGALARSAEKLELLLYRRSAGVTGTSDEIIGSIAERAPGVPTQVITNGVDPRRFGPHAADPEVTRLVGDEPGPVFLYAGLLGHAQRLGMILDLAARWPADEPGRFVLVGDGPEREGLAERIEREGIRLARLLPPQPRERVPSLLAAADVAIIPRGVSILGMVPSKMYEAMAAARPILLVSDGEPARRLADAGAGLIVPPGDPQALFDGARRLAGDPQLRARLGAAGRHAAETVYDRDLIADRLDRFLRERLGGSAARSAREAA